MALVLADRVKETTATTGTGTLSLAGAVTQFQSFSAGVGNGNSTFYCIEGGNGTDWEVGIGLYTSSGSTLARSVVLASSNSGSKINLTGTSTVFCTRAAGAVAQLGANVSGAATLTAHGVVVGNGTGIPSVTAAGTSGQALLSGGASADPAFGPINAAGAIVGQPTPLTFNGAAFFP